MKLIVAATLLLLLLVDWFEFHDLLEPKTLPEYLTGIVSVPMLALLLAHLVGLVRWDGAQR